MELITGVIRDYDWGDPEAIASLLGHEPPGHPEAEYWLGAHPSAPSVIESGTPLDRLIEAGPTQALGPAAADRFGRMPYLLKILAAAKPLSIQAHPSLDQARAGFAREDAAGIDRAAPDRNYRDDNHKPELICALTPFEAKCGFRTVAEVDRLLQRLGGPWADRLRDRVTNEDGRPDAETLADAVAWLLRLPVADATAFADEVVATAAAQEDTDRGDGFDHAVHWVGRIAEAFPGDIGIVVGLLLNHVTLAPGQAIFLEAGNLHSYLQGVGVELMANSDNVLRGGLTPKHVDVDELLSVVDYTPSEAPIQVAAGPIHAFDIPVPEFGLTRLDSTADADGLADARFAPVGPDIVLVTAGAVALEGDGGAVEVPAGGAALVTPTDGPYRLRDRTPGETVAWRATVGELGR
ncbi:MAG: mannose-6-phosphate isomerase, class I [Actinomycetota bacterium]